MIGSTSKLMEKVRTKELARYKITSVEAWALFTIRYLGYPCTAADISKRMDREHSTISALLLRMNKKGLITRTKQEGTKNWHIKLTEKGLSKAIEASKIETIHNALSVLKNSEKRIIEKLLMAVFEKTSSQLITRNLLFKDN